MMTFEELKLKMDQQNYIYDDTLATVLYVALTLGRPLLIEGAAGVGKTEIAKVHATKYKNWNLWTKETPLSEGDAGYYAKWNGVSDLGWYNGQQNAKSVFEEINAKYYGDNTDVNKNHLVYEVKISKEYAKTEYGVTEDKIEYIHFGLWSYYLAGVQARIGWGWEVSQDVSLATDLILPVNNDSYDLDDHLICIRLLDQDPATTTTTTSSATTTTTPPVVTTTTAPVTTTTTAPATTTTAAATTAAATTAATTEPSSGGCGSAMAISAAALIPALGIAFVTKKKED